MLELLDVTRSFGSVRALDGLTMRVGPGRIHGFVGRNGAGKTTAMRIVLGLVEPDSGEVRWRGGALTAADRRRIGYMPEERGLYPQMGAAEQVAYFARLSGLDTSQAPSGGGRRARPLRVGGAGRRQGADALARQPAASPAGLGAGAPVRTCSCSTSRSAASTRSASTSSPRRCGRRPAGDAAIVFSSHQLELVERLCDEVTIIEAGRVVASGTVDAVRVVAGAEPAAGRARRRLGHVGRVARRDPVGRRRDGDVVLELEPGGRRPGRARCGPCRRPCALVPMGRAEPRRHLPRRRRPSRRSNPWLRARQRDGPRHRAPGRHAARSGSGCAPRPSWHRRH